MDRRKKQDKRSAEKNVSSLKIRIFISVLLTGAVILAKYCANPIFDDVRKCVYYTVKENVTMQKVSDFLYGLAKNIK